MIRRQKARPAARLLYVRLDGTPRVTAPRGVSGEAAIPPTQGRGLGRCGDPARGSEAGVGPRCARTVSRCASFPSSASAKVCHSSTFEEDSKGRKRKLNFLCACAEAGALGRTGSATVAAWAHPRRAPECSRGAARLLSCSAQPQASLGLGAPPLRSQGGGGIPAPEPSTWQTHNRVTSQAPPPAGAR